MEERFRQFQRGYRSIGSSNNPRYPFHAVDTGIPLRHPPPPPPPHHHHHHAPPPLLANQGHAQAFDDRTAGGVAGLQRSARVPLEPWDRDAIIAYRNRVNANSRDLDFEGEEIYRHAPGHRNGSLQMGRERDRERGRRALLLEEEKADAERVRWERLRDIPLRTMVRRNQEFRDWPPVPHRDREHDIHPQSQLQPQSQFLSRPHPHPPLHQHQSPTRSATLEQKMFRYGLEKRSRDEEEDELQSSFHIRKRVTFQELGVANDGHFHPQPQWTAAGGDEHEHEHEHEHDRSPYSPPLPQQRGGTYFPSPPAQPRVRWHHDLFEPEEHTHNKILGAIPRERDSLSSPHLGRVREISGSIRSQQQHQYLHPPPPLSSIRAVDEDNMQMQKERELVFPKGLVENRQIPLPVKDLLLPSATVIGIGPQQHQLEARKGMMQVQSKGRNVGIVAGQSKKQKNKIPSWGAQTSKTKGKLKINPHSLPITSLAPVNEGKMLSQNELQEPTSQEEQSTHIYYAKYERSTDAADLSVVFKPSGMIAQEVVTSIDNNWPDYTRTNSSGSKELIQDHSVLEQDIEEEGEIRSIESQSTLMEKNALTDNHNAGSQSKNMSMTLISESVTSEGRSCYLDDLDNKTKTSAFGSQETGAPLVKHLPLDCWKIGSPAHLKTNQSEEKPPMVVSLPTCTTSLKLENDLFLSAPPEPKPSSEEMQEIASKVPSNYTCTDGSDLKERPKKKLKVEKTENHALNNNEEMDNPLLTSSGLHGGTEVIESQGPSVRVQEVPSRTLTANVSQQSSGAYPIQSLQPDTKSSQNAIFISTLPQNRPSIICSSMRAKAIANSGRATRSRTWHRTNNATSSFVARPYVIHNDATSAGQAVAKVENSQSAPYVRKGNSLVRAPCPPFGLSSLKSNFSGPPHIGKASIQKSSPLKGVGAAKDTHNLIAGNVGSNTRNSLTAFRLSIPALERPTTPPLLRTAKSPPCITGCPQTFVPAVVSVTPTEVQVLTTEAPPSDAFKVNNENISIDNQGMSDPSNNLSVCKSNLKEDHIENAGVAQMIYVKRKSNQLIAASTSKSQGSTTCLGESGQSPLNCLVQDRYYKRKKNQLVRSGLATESKITKAPDVPGARSSLDMELKVPMLKVEREMTFFRTKLGRVLKQKKHSWVWTLGKAESSRVPLLQSRHVASSLFPWKRPSYGRSGLVGKIKALPSISKGSSLSLISKKLKCLRKRDTVYTKSLNGFSLHRSGVLSIGGSNLKWTKSLEKRSKQASEEATMAVAAAEKKRREAEASKKKKDKRSSKPAQGIKLRARKSRETIGERIVHVGLFRYRMDPSKRTLQMIPAEESTSSIGTSHGCGTNDTSKLSTPRRVSIGGDEYLRVGNGNQLVRDPKKVCRVLASEKVRWSLHTARHRLAKKQQYCQFFTRFGKCNKEDGKCSYIHDREKVAVCTKFLKGICSNENCELTHKIIPERMEDCSYFLQGFCTNENCPYRHVNVNPKAPVCDGFLKGYCAEGDKCNKKHTYVCPRYAAKGECAERSTCKLHHPKKKDKPKISRRRKGGTNAKRRYFVPEDLGINELASALLRLNSELHPAQKTTLELPSRAPECLDFISLDGPEEGASDSDLIRGAAPSMKIRESDFFSNLGLPDDDIDMMIKPIHLLRKGQAVSN